MSVHSCVRQLRQAPHHHKVVVVVVMGACWYALEYVAHLQVLAKGVELFGLAPVVSHVAEEFFSRVE
jgi:hypothetical protein